MAVQQRLRVEFDDVFPSGAFMLGAAEAVDDYDLIQAARDAGREPGDVQSRDKRSGKRVWSVRVVDADPEARKGQAELSVKIDADQCPVPPEGPTVGPFRPVAFEGLSVTAYVDDNGRRPRVAYSLRASGFAAVSRSGGARSVTREGCVLMNAVRAHSAEAQLALEFPLHRVTQCEARTTNGGPCSRAASSWVSGPGALCAQHRRMVDQAAHR